jgi:hypothetical protein
MSSGFPMHTVIGRRLTMMKVNRVVAAEWTFRRV